LHYYSYDDPLKIEEVSLTRCPGIPWTGHYFNVTSQFSCNQGIVVLGIYTAHKITLEKRYFQPPI